MEDERETLTWEAFGDAAQELARVIADDGFRPDLILAIARGGMFVAGALGYAQSVVNLLGFPRSARRPRSTCSSRGVEDVEPPRPASAQSARPSA
jgi:adenine/guanine phosphoribosyltransferase-like PRPP-binding protein